MASSHVLSRRRRANRARSEHGARGPVWLFDLDNTLHRASHAIFPRINRAMTAYIVEKLGLPQEQANRLRSDYTERYGAVLLGLIRHHAIDPHEFLERVHELPPLAEVLRAERGIARLLAGLPGRKILLTNAPAHYALPIVEALGIRRHFERCVSIEDMADRRGWRAKPDAAMLRRLLARERLLPRRTWLVEDTRSHLKHLRHFGIGTVWITGHLPVRNSLGDAMPRSGRPHYVDIKVQSLRELRARLATGAGAKRVAQAARPSNPYR
ncbi:HAD-IA family hydrolase [Pandoraea nosoerga]|uniref:HAD-IA family hydrolase n=1 Tax=Pandoraea TaxID=93217 RepID=UPI0012422706|nr:MULTISPECIES: HAD-IA family hydrolase [Pandoraea]MBN4667294.1 HAD-IA family hydrolase [Pandoraea nosoerga]MBN4676577.1 HAD-IA family hydrolase [Pandoraea nosoerga]MBN4682139.1 HAD-IA family hydrolase [Pandoraea nosoerga]MBN4743492.1 HAD-IA family hydrolase [Pandoraea nosoerga]